MNMFEDYLPGQRPPREHPLRRMADAEWTQIGMGLDLLEDRVLEVCKRVRAYHVIRHCVTTQQQMAVVLERLYAAASYRTVKEMITLARKIRAYCADFKQWLLGLIQPDHPPLIRPDNGWKLLFLQRIRQCHVHNRTLHIERNWIRSLIAALPYTVHIDWQTLTLPIELEDSGLPSMDWVELD